MIESSYYRPKIYPYVGSVTPAEIDRAQSIDPSISMNRDKIEEIGRDGVVGYLKQTPTVDYRMTQLEYGSIEFWQKIVGTATLGADGQTGIVLNDFKTPTFDIAAYLTDDDGTFKGTYWYPKLRTAGFSWNIADPDAGIERTFDFVGENAVIYQGNNKYVIQLLDTSCSGAGHTIAINSSGAWSNYPAPVLDPDTPNGDNSDYFIRIVRTRSGTDSELTYTTDYTYNIGTKIITIAGSQASDIYKVYYTAGSYISGSSPFSVNDSDDDAYVANACSIYLYVPASGLPTSSNYLYRLQSVTVDVTFEREDYKEIGNKEVVLRGVNDKTVTVTLGRILEDFTIEEVLAGQATDYGKLDIAEFGDTTTLIVKFFSDSTKGTFKYGFTATGLSPTDFGSPAAINTYVGNDNTMEGEDLTITADNTLLGSL
jgi:hypothetical protein